LESAQGGERKTSNRIGIANIRESEKRMERGEEIQKKKVSSSLPNFPFV
jgi:hypothetical protein